MHAGNLRRAGSWLALLLSCLCFTCQVKEAAQAPVRISGIYPSLVLYNPQPFGKDFFASAGESGVGGLVPWAGKLWAITYSAHQPFGGSDKLYELDENLNLVIRPESIGGTHANRMIHRESEQLIIGPYFINKKGQVRSIASDKMPGRFTAVARHLTDPANKVYFFTMEEGLYEVEVHSLAVKTIHLDGNVEQVPEGVSGRADLHGYHGKGGYTGQGRLIVSNNGIETWQKSPTTGVLAEWNGRHWKEVAQKQFVEVTGPGDIYGNSKPSDPVWATGWDDRSVLVKLLEQGQWHDYRLPKASFTYDGAHGWYTEWPRIREIDNDRRLMTMHGMFWHFPGTFSTTNSAGIKPLSSYLKVIPDFAWWNGHIVFGTDDASTFSKALVGRPQSNLWFVKPDQLTRLGPRNGFGSVWLNDDIKREEYSAPFLVAGFDKKVLHLAHQSAGAVTFTIETDQKGNGKWTPYQKIKVPAAGYVYHVFPNSFGATWVRIKPDTGATRAIAYFVLSQQDTRQPDESPALFASIPKMKDAGPKTMGLIRAGAADGLKLEYVAYATDGKSQPQPLGYYEADGQMNLAPVKNDTMTAWLNREIKIKGPDFTADKASVILTDNKGKRYRLPKGNAGYAEKLESNWLRGIREVATERSLLNCYGTFYELPREITSRGVAGIKPIATHNRFIYDFCSWRGLMVIAGNVNKAPDNGNYFNSQDGKTGLWFGAIDDLWKFGKPHGKGGPWFETPVQAHVPSDPYLMTGYDNKTLTLSHRGKTPVAFTVEVDLTTQGDWKTFNTFTVPAGKPFTYRFPDGYSAHWVRIKANKDCQATAMLEYN